MQLKDKSDINFVALIFVFITSPSSSPSYPLHLHRNHNARDLNSGGERLKIRLCFMQVTCEMAETR